MSAIEILNVSKAFSHRAAQASKFKAFFRPKNVPFQALENINLNIPQGEIFTLLGPNGAGKTTLIKILCGLITPTTGEVRLAGGAPVEKAKHKIGLMLGASMIYYRITGYDNLKYFAKLYRVSHFQRRIDRLIDLLKLENWVDEYVEHYSTGMKAKLALARALIHDPEIVVLDEPTAGLDPAMAIEIRKLIQSMGKTIFLTTHNLKEAEDLSTRIALLYRGKIKTLGTLEEIRREAGLETLFLHLTNGETL